MSVRIYVEGGGKGSWNECRRGFAEFFRKVLPSGHMPRVIPCGSREDAFDDFCIALRRHPADLVILLVDAESRVATGAGPWDHLAREDRWVKPAVVTDDQAHLMVEAMEAWLVVDPQALARFYGQGFRASVLPGERDIEQVRKEDLLRALVSATRDTKSKGTYHKARHAFSILAEIDPVLVRVRSKHAERLCLFLIQATS